MENKKISLTRGTAGLSEVRQTLSDIIGDELDPIEKNRVILSIDEAAANILIHGLAGVQDAFAEIEIYRGPRTISFILKDNGPPFNPLNLPDTDMDEYTESGRHGGLGIYVYKKFMKASYERDANGFNILTLAKELPHEN